MTGGDYGFSRRPRVATDDRHGDRHVLTHCMRCRVSGKDQRRYQAAASAAGMTVQEWLIALMEQAIRRERAKRRAIVAELLQERQDTGSQ